MKFWLVSLSGGGAPADSETATLVWPRSICAMRLNDGRVRQSPIR
jgi:hypothetical protein